MNKISVNFSAPISIKKETRIVYFNKTYSKDILSFSGNKKAPLRRFMSAIVVGLRSIAEGISTFSIYSPHRKIKLRDFRTGEGALRSDWEAIGGDFKRAMEQVYRDQNGLNPKK